MFFFSFMCVISEMIIRGLSQFDWITVFPRFETRRIYFLDLKPPYLAKQGFDGYTYVLDASG